MATQAEKERLLLAAEKQLRQDRKDRAKLIDKAIAELAQAATTLRQINAQPFFANEVSTIHDAQSYINEDQIMLADLRDQLVNLPVSGHPEIVKRRDQLGLQKPSYTSGGRKGNSYGKQYAKPVHGKGFVDPRQSVNDLSSRQHRPGLVDEIRSYLKRSAWTTDTALANRFDVSPSEAMQMVRQLQAELDLRVRNGIIHVG